jgi:TonB family protein
MLLLGSRISRLVLVFLFAGLLATLFPAIPNTPPAQAPQTPLSLSFEQQDQLRNLAARVLEHADKAGCKKSACTILVANFTDSSGSTSIFGMQLAERNIQIVDRKRLYEFLETERIPSKFLAEDNAERWLAMEQFANAVLVGHLDGDGDKLTVTLQLLDAHFLVGPRERREVRKGPLEKVELTITGVDEQSRMAAEPFREASASKVSEDQGILRAGKNGVTVPSGVYMPTPDYTDPARIAKFQGSLIVLVKISEEGRAEDLKVLHGLPFGLNQHALNTVRTWKFRPATLDGKPVPVQVPIEVTFRLY